MVATITDTTGAFSVLRFRGTGVYDAVYDEVNEATSFTRYGSGTPSIINGPLNVVAVLVSDNHFSQGNFNTSVIGPFIRRPEGWAAHAIVRVDQIPASARSPVFFARNTGTSWYTNLGGLSVETDGRIAASVYDGTDDRIVSAGVVPARKWVAVGIRRDGESITVFLDGVRGATVAIDPEKIARVSGGTSLMLAGDDTAAGTFFSRGRFNGAIAEIAFFPQCDDAWFVEQAKRLQEALLFGTIRPGWSTTPPSFRQRLGPIGKRHSLASSSTASPPVISNLDPEPGTVLVRDSTISFDVTDRDGDLIDIAIIAEYEKSAEVIYSNGTFIGPFTGTVIALPTGYHFTVSRTGGWSAAPTVAVYALDKRE